jgi:hypothetical protein
MTSGKGEAFGHSPSVAVAAMFGQMNWRAFMRRLEILIPALVLAFTMSDMAIAASKSEKKQAQHQALLQKKSAAKEQNSDGQEHKGGGGTGLTVKAPKKHGKSSWLSAKESSLAEKTPRRGRTSDTSHP